ncbi:MAG: DUF2865 domain-containing protein, partial [Rhizomicrobium sp.]
MSSIARRRLALVAATAMCALALGPAAQAEDFFSALFGLGGGRSRAPSIQMPFASERNPAAASGEVSRPRAGYSGG